MINLQIFNNLSINRDMHFLVLYIINNVATKIKMQIFFNLALPFSCDILSEMELLYLSIYFELHQICSIS